MEPAKLERSLLKHPLWLECVFSGNQAWLDLVLTADDNGRITMSRNEMRDRWSWSRHQVYEFLDIVEDRGLTFFSEEGDMYIVDYQRFGLSEGE